MKISCLCVTESRPEFWPWLIWGYVRQTHKNRELIVIAGMDDPIEIPAGEAGTIVRVPAGTPVGHKRNLALEAASGEAVAWFDDDDWQHPRRLADLVAGIARGAMIVGGRRSWFVNLATSECEPYRLPQGVVFNGAGFARTVTNGIRFDDFRRKGTDTLWMRRVLRRAGRKLKVVDDVLSFWLCHDRNLSNPARARRFTHKLAEVRRVVGDAWIDSDQQLQELNARLRIAESDKERSINPLQSGAISQVVETPFTITPVSAVVKATILDTPWLEVLVPHMLEQARYPFHERLIVIDEPKDFSGKYASRARSSQHELDAVIERLKSAGHIDRVVNVDYTPERVREIMQRYFGDVDVPTHASTGGPIYATLFGLEEASQDYVVQYDADVLFWTDGASWVKQALAAMQQDPKLWLTMTHAGPIGFDRVRSLGERNRSAAVWDDVLKVWKFRHATTRYFLCRKAQLWGRVPAVRRRDGVAPLEMCLSAMLKAERVFRANLANGSSWHLHAWSHASPFPEMAPSIVKAIVEGRFPQHQIGSYDLRLDRPDERANWLTFLQNQTSERLVLGVPQKREIVAQIQSPIHQSELTTPISVVIPVRDRSVDWLTPTVASLAWQHAGRPEQVIIVSHGSRAEVNRGLAKLHDAHPWVELIQFGTPSEPWNKSKTLNIGIRATKEYLSYLMVLDADIILAPNFFQSLLAEMERTPLSLLMCRISDLPKSADVPRNADKLQKVFPVLQRQAHLRGRHGTGAMQLAPRSFFFDVQGYDEDFLWWGAMDSDIVQRAKAWGLRIGWIEHRTSMLHQWHPRKNRILRNRKFAEAAGRQWRINHDLLRSRSDSIVRNPRGWGELASQRLIQAPGL